MRKPKPGPSGNDRWTLTDVNASPSVSTDVTALATVRQPSAKVSEAKPSHAIGSPALSTRVAFTDSCARDVTFTV